MSDPKRHHYVTRAYLKRFSNGDHVNVLFKNADGSCSVQKNPVNIKKICVETDFYTLIEQDGKKNAVVEQSLARFEDMVSNEVFLHIQPDLIFPFQEGGVVLSIKQKRWIVDAIAVQIARGKSTREYGLSVIDAYYLDAMEVLKRQYDGTLDLQPQLDFLINNKESIMNNVLVEGPVLELLKMGRESELRNNLQSRVCFVFVNTTNLDFVTSDEPVLVCDGSKGEVGIFNCPLSNHDSIVYYPLDPKHMVGLYTKDFCHSNNNLTGNIVILGNKDRSFIQNANMAQYSQCNRCLISKDRKGLEELSNYINRFS